MPDVHEFYADQARINLGPFGGAIVFGLSPATQAPGPAPIHDVVAIRMSLEHMKVLAMLLRRQVKTYEDQMGVVNIPRQIYNSLGLSPEDW